MLSLFPINVSALELDEPLDEPPDELPDPLTVPPPGSVKVSPLLIKTTLPFLSVRYTDIPAEESLFQFLSYFVILKHTRNDICYKHKPK